jgi:hypothetical protein
MALGLTQSLTEMSIRNISWEVKAAGACAYCLETAGYPVAQSVEALCYKLEGRGFDSR